MDARRVAITGMGAVTPLGCEVDEFWNSIKNGVVGIGLITKFDTEGFRAKVAAEVKGFDADKYMERKETKRMDLYSQYGVAAAVMAFDDSGIDEETIKDNPRAGVIIGSGIGGLGTIQEQVVRLVEKGPERVAPLFIPMTISNIAAGNVAIRLGLKGVNMSIVTACATGTNCIGEAFRYIKHGYQDIILAGGAEASITKLGVAGFTSLTALSESDDPLRASIPFDRDRNGFVMGEGGGVLVLEELEHALARNAKIYAEVVGYGAGCDAHHMTAPLADGSGAAETMELAIEEAGVKKTDITYINAHGTSTEANDLPETLAVKKVFGEQAYKIPFSSTKSMTGHLLGAAGAIEAIICVKALQEDFAPPTAGLLNPADGCDLNYVPLKGVSHKMKYALSNSFGFGGHNAVICLKKWEGPNGL